MPVFMPDTGNGLHPPANLPRPPGMIAPGTVVIPPNAPSAHTMMDDVRSAMQSFNSTVESIGGGVVHTAEHIGQGVMKTVDAVEGGLQMTGRLLPLVLTGALGVYAWLEMGGPSKRQRLG